LWERYQRSIMTMRVSSPRPDIVLDAGDDMERAVRAPLLRQLTYHSFKRRKSIGPRTEEETVPVPPLDDKKKTGSKAPAVVLGFECLESTAFNGISTNLLVYLETVLHGSNLGSASHVTTWFGTSYMTPIFGAFIADTFLGNYNTILVSLAVYLLGML
jgi:peptide/histidine transporter 3/4